MYMVWSLVVILCYAARVTNGYSSGAPPARCGNMIPAHRRGGMEQILPQRPPVPYDFQLSKYTYSPGEQIKMRLAGQRAGYFKGILIKVVNNQGVALGVMSPPRGYKTITCGQNGNEAITHTEGSNKPGVLFTWTAPAQLSGTLSVRGTVVYDYGTFWVNEILATIEPAGSILPQVTTTVSPDPDPVLTTTTQSATKSSLLITDSQVMSSRTLNSATNVSDLKNTTAITGRDSILIYNETVNNSLGDGNSSFTGNAFYSFTDIANANNISNFTHNLTASVMLPHITDIENDKEFLTKSLPNVGVLNNTLISASSSVISVLDMERTVENSAKPDTNFSLEFNVNETGTTVTSHNATHLLINETLNRSTLEPDITNVQNVSTNYAESESVLSQSNTSSARLFDIHTTNLLSNMSTASSVSSTESFVSSTASSVSSSAPSVPSSAPYVTSTESSVSFTASSVSSSAPSVSSSISSVASLASSVSSTASSVSSSASSVSYSAPSVSSTAPSVTFTASSVSASSVSSTGSSVSSSTLLIASTASNHSIFNDGNTTVSHTKQSIQNLNNTPIVIDVPKTLSLEAGVRVTPIMKRVVTETSFPLINTFSSTTVKSTEPSFSSEEEQMHDSEMNFTVKINETKTSYATNETQTESHSLEQKLITDELYRTITDANVIDNNLSERNYTKIDLVVPDKNQSYGIVSFNIPNVTTDISTKMPTPFVTLLNQIGTADTSTIYHKDHKITTHSFNVSSKISNLIEKAQTATPIVSELTRSSESTVGTNPATESVTSSKSIYKATSIDLTTMSLAESHETTRESSKSTEGLVSDSKQPKEVTVLPVIKQEKRTEQILSANKDTDTDLQTAVLHTKTSAITSRAWTTLAFTDKTTTVTTLPPIFARTLRPTTKRMFRPPTTDVWLNMKPVPVTINNLFKLMPTTRGVWLKLEPTVPPPVFIQPIFKAPKLPDITTTAAEPTTARFTQAPVKVVPTATQDGVIEYDPACGSSKGCFVDCDGNGCKFMVTWQDVGYGVTFELFGRPKASESWIAVGFSKDTRMTDDSVTECIHSGGIVQAFNSYNPSVDNKRLERNAAQAGLTGISGSYYDGVFKCRFTRAYRVESEPRIFDLERDWNIMFAHGRLVPGRLDKNVHTEMPSASASRIDYQSVVVVGKAAKFTLVKVHGCLMILSWVLFVGVGICVARYYKNVWSDKTFLKLKIWFQVHRSCMVTALVLDLIAIVIIFVDVQGYSQIPDIPGKYYLKSHPVLGIIVTLLCIANPVMALFRPGPTDSKRPIFNWAHWGVGISAYILSALTICFGFELGKASTPDYAVYIMIGYIVYIVLFDLACEVHDFLVKKEKKGKTESMEMSTHNGTDNGVPNGNSTSYSSKEKNKKSDRLKTILLAFHIAFTGAFALVMVLVVALN